jgi:archaellum biogenesis protein FlaJ (TadC family)
MMENTKEKLTFYVTFMVSITLCISVLAMVAAFILGLWAKEVDNAEIFKMISPAFSTLIGGMIGFLSGIKLNQSEDDKPKESKNDGTRCAAASGRETDRQADT